jgi:hypothetical protein
VCEKRKTWGAEEKDAQDYVLGNFQPPLRDFSIGRGLPRTYVLGYSQPSLRDWSRYNVMADLFSASAA